MNVSTLYRLSWIGVFLALIVVSLGAYTRLADAGLGCPDWPGCYGFLTVPQTDHHVAVANSRFPDAPVEQHKGWAEMIHRYVAGALGLLIATLAIAGWRHRHAPRFPRTLSVSLVGLVIIQALFGMWTVTLKLWPQVVTLHLLGGFATLSLLFLLMLKLRQLSKSSEKISSSPPPTPSRSPLSTRRLSWLALVLVVGQIALGGWTSANYAAFACPDFPTCQGQWWPENMAVGNGLNITQHVGPNYLGGTLEGPARIAIHVIHRLGALTVTLIVGLLCLQLWRQQQPFLAISLAAILSLQLTIGIANVFWQFPLPLALAHNTGAALLLLTLTAILSQHYLHSTKDAGYETHRPSY